MTSAACSSCQRATPVLVVLDSPRGEYALCRLCLCPGKQQPVDRRRKR